MPAELLIIAPAALAAAALTFLTGFGLGTLLLPVFALFFPVELAVALTAVVHLANNLLKLVLVGRHAERRTLLRFGIPALAGAYVGAQGLLWLSGLDPLGTYRLGPFVGTVTPVKVTVATLLAAFTLADLHPGAAIRSVTGSHLVAGGLLSGIFGGLSGHQGALRSAFLIRSGLTKEQFLGTGVILACLVDLARLPVYASGALGQHLLDQAGPALVAVGAAFLGTMIGNRLLPRIELEVIRVIVSALVLCLALGLGAGIL